MKYLKQTQHLLSSICGVNPKRNNPQMISINKSFFHSHKSTANKNGDKGATSLGDALKSNTTLTTLYLGGEDKGNNTQMIS